MDSASAVLDALIESDEAEYLSISHREGDVYAIASIDSEGDEIAVYEGERDLDSELVEAANEYVARSDEQIAFYAKNYGRSDAAISYPWPILETC